MDRSPSKDKEEESVSGMVRQRSVQSEKKNGQHSLLVELIRNHPMIRKTLTHQKVESFRRNLQESQRARTNKNLRNTSKNFVEKSSPQLLQMLTEMTYRQFALFLRSQKKIDDQKMKKLGRLIRDWQSEKNKPDWKGPLNNFFEREKMRYNKKSFK